jgi:hypothetical protein
MKALLISHNRVRNYDDDVKMLWSGGITMDLRQSLARRICRPVGACVSFESTGMILRDVEASSKGVSWYFSTKSNPTDGSYDITVVVLVPAPSIRTHIEH